MAEDAKDKDISENKERKRKRNFFYLENSPEKEKRSLEIFSKKKGEGEERKNGKKRKSGLYIVSEGQGFQDSKFESHFPRRIYVHKCVYSIIGCILLRRHMRHVFLDT